MAAEFKLGRLRYNWAGIWDSSTEYARDDVINFQGKAYICLVAHTSNADFNEDLTAIPFPYWEILIEGKTWQGPWETATNYALGNIVIAGGAAYYCIDAHTSTSFTTDFTKWATYSQSADWNTSWTTNTEYNINSVVKYGGVIYKCITNHTSAATASLGLEADLGKWTVYFRGIEYKGDWQPNYRYKLNDLVKINGNIYVALSGHTSGSSTFTPSNWTVFLPGQVFKLVWNNSVAYQVGDAVIYGGDAYVSRSANNTGNNPSSDNVNWSIFNQGYNIRGDWANNVSYRVGDVVRRGGMLYEAVLDHTAQDPSGTTAISTVDTLSFTYVSGTNEIGTGHGAVFDVSSFPGTPGYTVAVSSARSISNPVITSTSGDFSCDALSAALVVGQPVTINEAFSSGSITSPAYVSGTTYYIIGTPTTSTFQLSDTVDGSPITTTLSSGVITGITITVGSAGTGYAVDDTVKILGTQLGGASPANDLLITIGSVTSGAVTTITPTSGTPISSSGRELAVSNVAGVVPGMVAESQGITVGQTVISVVGNLVTLDRDPNKTVFGGDVIFFNGVNATYWSIIIPGQRWTGRWTSGITYLFNDIVVWGNGTYRCIQEHLSDLITRPDQPFTLANYHWILLVSHVKNNSLLALGDMETFNVDRYQQVQIGGQGEILRSTNYLPVWSQINLVPKVFYVDSYIGEDRVDYGTTWNTPFKTIAYSCNFIRDGFYNQTAAAMLEANTSWMVTEMYQWMLYQMSNSIAPFEPTSLWDANYTQRDAAYIVHAISYDLLRGGNSQTVAAILRFFDFEEGTTPGILINSRTAAVIEYIVASLEYLATLMQCVVTNTQPAESYQTLNGISGANFIYQVIDLEMTAETGAAEEVASLMAIINVALSNQSTTSVPPPNSGTTAVINIKTGTYDEVLPITVPENVSLVGDELRSVQVQPITAITMYCSQTYNNSDPGTANRVKVNSTVGLADEMPVQFISPFVNNASTTFGGVESGVTYYIDSESILEDSFRIITSPTITFIGTTTLNSSTVSNVTNITNITIGSSIVGPGIVAGTTILSVSQSVNEISTITISNPATATYIAAELVSTGSLVELTNGTGSMLMYAGDCLKDMFLMRNGTTMRNMTLGGLLGTLTQTDEYGIARPTGGTYTSLDPGNGPDDTSAWIYRRSPYVQNITTFGTGCTGMKIDGSLHNGGFKSMVSNDYTQILNDGVGVWCTGSGALTECVSVFSYYNYMSYYAELGGRIRATNGNSSYGTLGAVSEGFDVNETPITGNILNTSLQVQAQVVSSFGIRSELLKLLYSNAGSAYYKPATNLLKYSNGFLDAPWANDGNVTFIKNEIAPTGYTEGWLLTGTENTSGDGYVYQNITINPAGYIYSGLAGSNISGSGSNATFNVTIKPTGYVVTVATPGTFYAVTNQILISGANLGGITGINDLIITVTSLSGSGILGISTAGTIPSGGDQHYTLSVYVYPGTSEVVDLQGIFSGTTTLTSGITYNVTSNVVTPYSSGGGLTPTEYGAQKTLVPGWYRIWMSVNDLSGINTNLQFRFFPSGATSPVAETYGIIYGAQVEISLPDYAPNFYFETTNTRYSSFANYQVVGAGTGIQLVADEARSSSVFNTRVVADENGVTGGAGYATANNNAQAGNETYIQIAQSEQGLNTYNGMRIFINSGTGAGQYGYIATYDNETKIIQVLRESVDAISITQSASGTDLLSISPGTDLSKIYVDQQVQFTPTYYNAVISQTSIAQVAVTSTIGGATNYIYVEDSTALAINMPVTFSGTLYSTLTTDYTYFISNIVDETTIQISSTIFGAVWQLSAGSGAGMYMNYPSYTGYLEADSTASMSVGIPIQFAGSSIGGVTLGQPYYVSDVIDAANFTISGLLISDSVTASSAVNNGLTMSSTGALIPLNPISFGGTMFESNITAGTKYYISNIIDSNTFNITSSIIRVNCTATALTSNLITCESVAGFVSSQPIRFSGKVMGNIVAETLYYIQSINVATNQFTISSSVGGGAVTLFDATGSMKARTCPTPKVLAGGSGTMTITSTGNKFVVTAGYGSMNATFSTAVFGGLDPNTVYYITAIDTAASPDTITVSETLGGAAVTLLDAVGAMEMGVVGWDHINPGTPISPSIDSTSQYFIEPRVTFTAPAFSSAAATSVVAISPVSNWQSIAWGNDYFVAIPSAGATGAYSTNGSSWTSMTMPSSQSWTSVAYGNNYYVAVSSGGQTAAFSNNAFGWRPSTLPSTSTWSSITYGNGTFVAIATNTNKAAYSTNFGKTWAAATLSATDAWVDVKFGGGLFLAIASTGVTSYSTDGVNWQTGALPSGSNYKTLAYGDQRFVAVQNTSGVKAAYSFDGIAWSQSETPVNGSLIAYGDGVFLVVKTSSGQAYTSDSGLYWTNRTITSAAHTAIGFGYTSTHDGVFAILDGYSTGITVQAGARAQGRVSVDSGVIVSVDMWEPGSNYQSAPTVEFTDFNVSIFAAVEARIGNGTLANPTFINRGSGYATSSTFVSITGNGYADQYQTGYTIIIDNLSSLPTVGSNLAIAGNDQIYKVTSAEAVYGTTAPFIQANVQISPTMSNALSPDDGAAVQIRQLYSQCRLTNHDFLSVGVGNSIVSNYPNIDTGTATPNNQTVEANQGRVFYTSTDQDGNFSVGGLFGVQQATGTVTLSATQFGLSGLNTLSLGGIALGGQSVVVTQFGTDGTFSANLDSVIPTQRAIKTYLTSRLSQGGANTFTGQLTAGTVVVGGANFIRSTVPNGTPGSSIVWTGTVPAASQTRAYFRGAAGYSTVDGNVAALDFFMRNATHKS